MGRRVESGVESDVFEADSPTLLCTGLISFILTKIKLVGQAFYEAILRISTVS